MRGQFLSSLSGQGWEDQQCTYQKAHRQADDFSRRINSGGFHELATSVWLHRVQNTPFSLRTIKALSFPLAQASFPEPSMTRLS